MGILLKDSKTKDNLMRAFAGESQARNRYQFSASIAKKHNLHVIEAIFTFTANQEKEHGEIFYNLLGDCAGMNINVDGNYPVDLSQDVSQLLKFAHHNEYEEFEDAYPAFGKIAREEGFDRIAATFNNIAKIEKTHGDRFAKYAKLLEDNQLFVSNIQTGWMCLNCGYIFEGKQAPPICPVCDHNQGYFIRLESAPF